MKMTVKNLFLLPALVAGLGLIPTGRATAQTFKTLYSFTALDQTYSTNSDGANPYGGLILSGNTLYGTTYEGGSTARAGTVFRVDTDGTDFTNLHNFAGNPSNAINPYAGLILSNNTLYGTAYQGGSSGGGAVFKVNTDGTGYTNLHNFVDYPSEGAFPEAGLILSGNTLYGTTYYGGANNNGSVFAVNTDGSGYTNMYSFTVSSGPFPYTNSDGGLPSGTLILSGNTLYGTAGTYGINGAGTVFAINTNGTGFTNLYSFTAVSPPTARGINSDGAHPTAGLILSGNTLYGTAGQGGSSGYGTVFAVNTDGMVFTNLHSFTAAPAPLFTNSDGAGPNAGLILSGNTLYGTAAGGGISGNGTMFSINTNGTSFTVLHSFTADIYNTNSDGATIAAGLILSGNTLYGTAYNGGSSGNGTVFSLSLPLPQLTITYVGNQSIVSWPSPVTGWTLQTNNNLVTGTWGNYAGSVSNNSVTNSPPRGNIFFRLMQP